MKATIVNTVENTTKVAELPETVADLASLKHYLGISDGQLFEGTTHTDLTFDSQALPALPDSKKEKGYVFFVSPAQNKIKNGAYSRKECYAIITEQNLGDKVKAEFGRNFTQVATNALNNIISIYANGAAPSHTEGTADITVEDEDAGKIVTEKELWQALIGTVAALMAALPEGQQPDVAVLVEGVNKVFPNPYSVQDLANIRN